MRGDPAGQHPELVERGGPSNYGGSLELGGVSAGQHSELIEGKSLYWGGPFVLMGFPSFLGGGSFILGGVP